MAMFARPRFRPHWQVEILAGEGIVLLSETRHVILAEPLYASVAAQLDGHSSADEIVAALNGEVEGAEVRRVLADLERRGLLTDNSAGSAADAAFWASRDVDPALAQQRLATETVSVVAVGEVDPAPFCAALRAQGVQVGGEAPRQLVLTDDYLRPELEVYNREAIAAERDWLLVKPSGRVLWLGPLFRPEQTACWECLALRLRANRNVETYLMQQRGSGEPLTAARGSTPACAALAAHLVALSVATWLAHDTAPALEGSVVTLDSLSWQSETHPVVARPQCPACGDPPASIRIDIPPIVLQRRRKTFVADGGHRACAPEVTLERFRHHVSHVSGIVPKLERNGTARDSVMHAYFAGANLSRPPRQLHMLSEGLRSRVGGKGATDAQARASALCEALERYSGVFQGNEPRRESRLKDLGGEAIHPNACMGFSDRQYRERAAWNAPGDVMQAVPLPFDEDTVISWSPVWSLTRREVRYLPTAFCYFDYPTPEVAYCIACSNGNAAGNTIEEAILQGFLELVERDSVALWWYSRARRPRVVLDGFDEPYARQVQAYLAERDRDLTVLDLTSDLEIPVFAAVSRHRAQRPEQIVLGFGAHLDARIALLRAIGELNQMLMRLLWIDAADESASEPGARAWLQTATLAEQRYLEPDARLPERRGADFARSWSDDLSEDVRYCQRLVEARGMEFLVLDQTRPDVGLPVVKVIVPGLRHFWARFAPGRLYDVPVQLGWIAAPLREAELNPIPMFL